MTAGVLVNIAGFLLGGVLYGLLLAMGLGSHRASRAGMLADLGDRLAKPVVLTGLLGLLWNTGGFFAYGFPALEASGALPGLLVVSYAALGFLPAVTVHAVLTGAGRLASAADRATTAAAYVLSAAAAALQALAALTSSPVPSRPGLAVLTIGFTALLVPLLAITRRARGGRALWFVAISVFAVSALHLTQHTGREAWWVEALGHHGSILLALAILHWDYRFAFADMFLKRALALSLVVALVLALHLVIARMFPKVLLLTEASLAAYVLAMAVITALAQPRLRAVAAWLVDDVVLQRTDYEELLRTIERDLRDRSEEEGLADRAGAALAGAVGATSIRTVAFTAARTRHRPDVIVGEAAARAAAGDGAPASAPEEDAPAALVTIPTVEEPFLAWRFGRLEAGRRLLSDEMHLLENAASIVGRRLDALRVARARVSAEVREQEIGRLATEAELRALRAQMNPHFLFNALNTIGHLIRTAPASAEATLLRLTGLLRAVLRRTRAEFTTLGEEIDLVRAYLEIEQARFEERLRVTVDVPEHLRAVRIPSLIVQPLVENAVKHGIAPLASGGDVAVEARSELTREGQLVRIVVRDSGAGAAPGSLEGRGTGVGLESVLHRLRCHFGDRASLVFDSKPDAGTTVALVLPLEVPAHAPPTTLH